MYMWFVDPLISRVFTLLCTSAHVLIYRAQLYIPRVRTDIGVRRKYEESAGSLHGKGCWVYTVC